MVLKLAAWRAAELERFESDVISDGTQTMRLMLEVVLVFESDVISDGTQTFWRLFVIKRIV